MITFETPINSLGYGQVGTGIVDELVRRGIKVKLFNSGRLNIPHELYRENIEKALSEKFTRSSISIKNSHVSGLITQINGVKKIGLTAFELDRFNDLELDALNSPDMVLTHSDWGEHTIREAGIKTAGHFNLGYDPRIFVAKPKLAKGPYTFINIGKFETRKNQLGLIDAFNTAFSHEDNVLLVLLCSNPFFTQSEMNIIKYHAKMSKLWSKIVIIDKFLSTEDMVAMINNADCGVFPSRGEGFNLPALECMALGKDIILSECTAHLNFAKSYNIRYVEVDEYEDAWPMEELRRVESGWFYGQGKWAKLGDLFQHRLSIELFRAYNDKLMYDSIKGYTWADSVDRLLEIIK